MIVRFLLLSVVSHGLALAWAMGQPPPEMLRLAAPPLSVTIYAQHTASSKNAHYQGNATQKRSTVPVKSLSAATGGQTHAKNNDDKEVGRHINNETNKKRRVQYHNQLIALVRLALGRYFTYPPLARKYGWEGEVHLNARLGADGQLHNIRVSRSSGYAILDDDAVYTLQQIGTVPHIPPTSQWLGKQDYDFELPVIYRLTQGS
ncbi:MAG TPA: energy transducer TonB [Acidiferrobacteraceae bacterium]|nr:energy transducer TonB [Acidiferrobacteraceae bacterium]